MDSRELGHITSDLSAYDTMGNPEIMQISLINEKIRRQERNQNAWRRIFLYFIQYFIQFPDCLNELFR